MENVRVPLNPTMLTAPSEQQHYDSGHCHARQWAHMLGNAAVYSAPEDEHDVSVTCASTRQS